MMSLGMVNHVFLWISRSRAKPKATARLKFIFDVSDAYLFQSIPNSRTTSHTKTDSTPCR
jgi:hypothetical protein